MQLPLSLQAVIRQKLCGNEIDQSKMQCWPVGGGSINETYRITLNNQSFFCKLNSATKFPQLFQKENNGLALLRKHGNIKLPSTIDCFEYDGYQVLLLEWIDEGERTVTFWKKFGEELARLHMVTQEHFGLSEDNYMGSVVQFNKQHDNWSDFFFCNRIEPMVKRCVDKKLLATVHIKKLENLSSNMPALFDQERPSLLHGDLWSGNFMCDLNNQPVLIDPAVYYGHRSVDLAMTTLFGGFRQPFYDAYHYHFPLPANHKEQWEICNLYPLLVHLYLFGAGYLSQIENTLSHIG